MYEKCSQKEYHNQNQALSSLWIKILISSKTKQKFYDKYFKNLQEKN